MMVNWIGRKQRCLELRGGEARASLSCNKFCSAYFLDGATLQDELKTKFGRLGSL